MKLVNVSKIYNNKNKALDNINLSFNARGVAFIVGSSG